MTATIAVANRTANRITSRNTGPTRGRSHGPRPVGQRTYARRRAALGGVSAIVAAIGLVATFDTVVGSSGAPASAAAGRPLDASGGARTHVVARPGDTLWSIAEAQRGDIAVRAYVDALIDLNGGPSIQAGQRVRLP